MKECKAVFLILHYPFIILIRQNRITKNIRLYNYTYFYCANPASLKKSVKKKNIKKHIKNKKIRSIPLWRSNNPFKKSKDKFRKHEI